MRSRFHPIWLCVALAAAAALGASPATAQMARKKEAAAAAAQQPASGTVPLRVGLVISDAARSYRQSVLLTRFEFGKHLANQTETVFRQTFTSVRLMQELPADPHANQGLDLIVVLEVPEGSYHQAGLITGMLSLTARYTVRDANESQLFQMQETDSEKGTNANVIMERLTETVARKFVQDLLVTERVRALLAPAPAAPAEVKVALDDTTVMESSGLDVPPPPPWGTAPAPGTRQPGGKP
jgi:hypothetical protein